MGACRGPRFLWTVLTALREMLPTHVRPHQRCRRRRWPLRIDGGRAWRGRRLLGGGEIWRGTIGRAVADHYLALLLDSIRPAAAPPMPSFPRPVAVALSGGRDTQRPRWVLRQAPQDPRAWRPRYCGGLTRVRGRRSCYRSCACRGSLATFTQPALIVVLVLLPLLHHGRNRAAFTVLKHEPGVSAVLPGYRR